MEQMEHRPEKQDTHNRDSRRRINTAALLACCMVGVALVIALVLIALFGSYSGHDVEHYIEKIKAEDLYAAGKGKGSPGQENMQGQTQTGSAAVQDPAAGAGTEGMGQAGAQTGGTAAEQQAPAAGSAAQESGTEAAETGEGSGTAAAVQTEPAAPAVIPSRVIFVGDSRTVQMEIAVDYDPDLCSFVGESGMGYDWLASTGIYQAEGKLGPYNSAIILNMGVNDLGNVKRYAALVNRKASEWKLRGAAVYYASVNPVNDGYPTVSNEQIRQFNETLQSLLSADIQWIDTYSYMVNNGYTATDGLHYDKNTYRSLYSYYLTLLGLQ